MLRWIRSDCPSEYAVETLVSKILRNLASLPSCALTVSPVTGSTISRLPHQPLSCSCGPSVRRKS